MQFIENFLLPVVGLGLGGVISVMLYRHIVTMRQSLSPSEYVELLKYRRCFSLGEVRRDGEKVNLTPKEELGIYRFLEKHNPQIQKIADKKGIANSDSIVVLDVADGKLKRLDVEGMVSGPGDSEQDTKDYSRSNPTAKGDPDFTRSALRKNEDFPGLNGNSPVDVTPSQVSTYPSSGIHFSLTKNKIEEHYKERNTVRRKGRGLIRASRTSQRNYRERC